MQKRIVFLGLLACPLLACGSSDGNFSCDDNASMEALGGAVTAHLCAEYDAIPSDLLATVQMYCTTAMATTGTSCPTKNLLGTCTIVAGGYTQHLSYYSDVGGLTADQAQMDCTQQQKGTWTAR
jgi:hypothetical protein